MYWYFGSDLLCFGKGNRVLGMERESTELIESFNDSSEEFIYDEGIAETHFREQLIIFISSYISETMSRERLVLIAEDVLTRYRIIGGCSRSSS